MEEEDSNLHVAGDGTPSKITAQNSLTLIVEFLWGWKLVRRWWYFV